MPHFTQVRYQVKGCLVMVIGDTTKKRQTLLVTTKEDSKDTEIQTEEPRSTRETVRKYLKSYKQNR